MLQSAKTRQAAFIMIILKMVSMPHAGAMGMLSSIDTTWHYGKEVMPEQFDPGYRTAIFGDNVNARAAPSQNSAILHVLPIGQSVSVVAFDSTRLAINGRTACWHLVGWTDAEKQERQAWVWGGYLALGVAVFDQDIFLLGCTRVEKSAVVHAGQIFYTHEIKVVRDFTLIDKIELPEVRHGESPVSGFMAYASRGIPDVKNIVHFNWSGAFCGGTQEDYYALWTQDGQWQLLPSLKSMGEAGFGTETEEYVFPDEREQVAYKYPLGYFYENPENQASILYLKEESGGDENGASVSIKINKLIFDGKNWKKPN